MVDASESTNHKWNVRYINAHDFKIPEDVTTNILFTAKDTNVK